MINDCYFADILFRRWRTKIFPQFACRKFLKEKMNNGKVQAIYSNVIFFPLLIKRRVLLKRINKFREKCQKLGNKQMSFNMRMNKYIIVQKPQCNISLQSLAAILKSKNQ